MSVKVWSLFPNFVDAVCFLISWPWLLIFACPCLLLVFAEQITSCSWWSYARRGKSSVLGNLPFSYQCRNLQKKEKAKNYNTLLFSLSPILYSRGASRKTKFQNLHELIFSRRSKVVISSSQTVMELVLNCPLNAYGHMGGRLVFSGLGMGNPDEHSGLWTFGV